MATKASYQIETLGSVNAPLASKSPGGKRKSRWPAVKKVLGGTPSVDTPPKSGTSKPPNSGGHRKPRWPAARRVLWGELNRSAGYLSSTRLNVIKVPDYCEEHVPLHTSFTDEANLGKLLAEMERKDLKLQEELEILKSAATVTSASNERGSFDFSGSIDPDELRDKFEESVEVAQAKRMPDHLRQYQDFVSSFVSVLLQSKFAKSSRDSSGISCENDPNDIIRTMGSTRTCPDVHLFRRVAVDPSLLAAASPDEDNPGFAENGVAVNQLARLLDVAVLQFLSTVNEHTDIRAVVWALDYMKNLLSSLITSMNSLNSFGWYGAPHIRIRKGTAMGRRSITYPMQPPHIIPPPPVVVVGTPPSSPRHGSPDHIMPPSPSPSPPSTARTSQGEFRDPVTGQPSPIAASPVHSPLAQRQTTFPRLGTELGSEVSLSRSRTNSAGSSGSKVETRGSSQDVMVVVGAGSTGDVGVANTGGGGRRRRTSRQEYQHDIISQHHPEIAFSPPQSPIKSLSPPSSSPSLSPSPIHSPTHKGTSPVKPSERKRKVTPAPIHGRHGLGGVSLQSVPGGMMGSIQEDLKEEEEEKEEGKGLGSVGGVRSYASSMVSIREEDEEEEEEEEEEKKKGKKEKEEMFAMDSVEKDYFDSIKEEVGPPIVKSPPLSPLATYQSKYTSPLATQSPASVQRLRGHSPPGMILEGPLSPTERPTSPMRSPEFSPSPSPIHYKGRGKKASSMTPPPAPKDIPEVDMNLEMMSLLNGEGRISLIAILHAIAKFPRNENIWTAEVGEKCFSLIQLCMDIGMPPQKEEDALPKPSQQSSSQERRRRFFKQENTAFNRLGRDASTNAVEKPWKVHSKLTIKFAINALIQCGICCIIGCSSTDNALCRFRYSHLVPDAAKSSSVHSRLIHNMRRIHLHSPATFREALIEFADPAQSSCRRVFQFLHVVLQYCVHGNGEMYFNNLLASVVVSVLRITVDRVMELDITEKSIQDAVIREACDFIHYSNQLFYHDTVAKSKAFQHLHMYIHRIALSVILPPRPLVQAEEPVSPLQDLVKGVAPYRPGGGRRMATVDIQDVDNDSLELTTSGLSEPPITLKPRVGSLPGGSSMISEGVMKGRREVGHHHARLTKHKSLGSAVTSSPVLQRARSSSFNSPSSSSEPATPPIGSEGEQHTSKSATKTRTGKSPLLKQQTIENIGPLKSLFSKTDSVRSSISEKTGGGGAADVEGANETEWRGLRLDALRHRIQRLVVLMNLSEPGTIPNPSILASLLDLCDGNTVVARSMVFLECALFVRRLSNHTPYPPCTIWVRHNADSPRMYSIAANLRKWAEAIGEKLRLSELRDKEMHVRLQNSKSSKEFLPEEPVFPDVEVEDHDPNIGLSISYALKMAACNLLLEITKFLRDIPPHFAPAPPVSQVGTPLVSHHFNLDPANSLSFARRVSDASAASSEAEGGTAHLNRGHSYSSDFKVPSPSIGHFKSSLSVEDAEPPHIIEHHAPPSLPSELTQQGGASGGGGGGEEHALPLNTSPRKKRTSFYLHINTTSKTPSGSLNRNTSIRKQSRMVRVTETPTSVESRTLNRPAPIDVRAMTPRAPSGGLSTSPSQRKRRKSISTTQRRNSIYHTTTSFLASSQPSHAIIVPSGIRGRRKSVGALYPNNRLEYDYNNLTPTTPVTPHPPAGQSFGSSSRSGSGGGGGGGGASGFGNSLNIGFSKLKRSAQKAFRRHGSKHQKGSVSEVSPNSSPGPIHRSKSHVSDTYSQKSVFYPSLSEESWRYYPWLDMLEHMVLINTRQSCKRHKRSCQELICALKKVYCRSPPAKKPDEESSSGVRGNRGANKKKDSAAFPIHSYSPDDRKQSSLGSIFIHRLTVTELDPLVEEEISVSGGVGGTPHYNRIHSLPVSRTKRSSIQPPMRSVSADTFSRVPNTLNRPNSTSTSPFARLTFSRVSSTGVISNLLANKHSEETIQLTIEAESPYDKGFLTAQADKERRRFIDFDFAGLMHSPFSTLVYAAPILHPRTFSTLKGVAWDALIGPDQELSHAAAAFFLLASAKESEKTMKGFVASKVLSRGPEEQCSAILKFKVLWDCRYGVWPRMEERAQKKLNLNDKEDRKENEQTIGYSLLANLLGHPGDDLPLSPCDPVSVCSNTKKACGNSPGKCYRPTKLAPIIHTDEISEKVHGYSVSGVSLTQEAGIKSSSVVYHGFESEDAAAPREWEAVDPTLFPRTLLPLIKFLLQSLVPSSSPSPSPAGPSQATPTTKATPTSAGEKSEDLQLQLDKSELARQVVWACMVEDPRLFFRPLFNRFNKLYMLIGDKNNKKSNMEYLMASCLKPFHIVLQAFPKLPSQAAHVLFNNFVGVVLQHTDQPYSFSGKIVQSVLTLIAMVTPSVQGLDTKLLKSILKKESCYTTMMSTARIRGVDKVIVLADNHYGPRLYKVTEEMTFGHLIGEACETEHLSLELLNKWYLEDRNKGIPLMSSLVVQDHYSVSADQHHPTFILHQAESTSENVWGHQMDQLFVFKMSEIMRILFTMRLLKTGPEVEKGFTYSEYAMPNYQFIHNELVELNSFPRKALTSIVYEAGPNVQHIQLRSSDVMLKGMWVRFVLELISSASAEFDWSNSMLLFINVVNGALLLHSDDQTILYYSLVTILTAVTKFNSIFKKDGYQMIIPALVQVYSLHLKNKLVTKAIKFVWRKFYLLNENVFFLQVTAASSTLLSDEAAMLSSSVNSKLALDSRRSLHMEVEDVRRLNAKALFELNSTLMEGVRGVQDELNILHCCQQYLDGPLYQTLTTDLPRQGLSVKDAAVLCVTLARWNPEALRGMQVLVFLDHMMPHILPSLGMPGQKFIMETLQYLVRGCESIAKVQRTHKRENVRRKAGGKGDKKFQALGQSFADDDTVDPRFFTAGNTGTGTSNDLDGRGTATRKSSVAKAVSKIKIIYNPKTKNLAAAAHQQDGGGGAALVEEDTPPTSHKLVHQASVAGGGAGGTGGQNQFRLTRTDHRVVRLSTNSLLSIVSEFFLYYSRKGISGSVAAARKHSTTRKPSVTYFAEGVVEDVSRVSFDPPSVSVLVTIATNMLLSYNEQILQGKGLNHFFLHLLPNLDWSDQAHLPAFSALLGKIFRLFKHLQKNTNKAILLYDNLTNFIIGITRCIHNSPHLVQGQDQHLLKLKSILDVVMVMQSGRSDPQMSAFHKRYSRVLHRPLLENAPSGFAEAVIGLAAELIMVTNGVSDRALSKNSYHMSDLVTHKSLKEYEEFLMPKIILPLCIQLGLRADTSKVSVAREDVDFMIQFVEGNKLELFFKFPHQKLLIEQIFRVVRVICCAFSESLTLYQWHKLAHWIFSLLNKKLSLPSAAKKTSSASINNVSKVDLTRTARDRNRLSSISGSSVSPLESFISFHENLLLFFESFLLVYRVPLFSLLFPILWKLEPVLQEAKEKVKVENPAQLEKVTNCIDRCQKLQRLGSQPPTMKSREQLLKEILDDLRWVQYHGRATLNRSHTTVESKKKSVRKRRSSVTLSKIKEEAGSVEGFSTTSASLPRSAAINVKKGRRNMLGLQIPRSASASAGTSHRPPSSPTGGPLSPPASAGITGGKEKQRFVAASLPRRAIASKPGLSTIEASPSRRPRGHSPIPPGQSSPRRSPMRKSPREGSASPETTTRGEGKRVRTKSKTAKHLKQLGGSVEYPADDEGITDHDTSDVIVNSQTNSPAQPRQQGHAKEAGSKARMTRGSPSLFKKKMVSFDESLTIDSHPTHLVNSGRSPPQVVVDVEVHDNNDVAPILEDHTHQRHTHLSQDEVKSKQRSPSNSPSLSKHDFFSESLGSYRQISPRMLDASITSETKLLPDSGSEGGGSKGNSPSAKRKMRRSKSPSLSSMKKMLSLSQSPTIQGDDEGERLLEKNSGGGGSPYFAWGRTHPAGVKGEDSNAAVNKRAFSWERRPSNSSSGKGLPQFSDSDSDDTAL